MILQNGLLIFQWKGDTFRNKIIEIVKISKKTYNNNGKPWKSSRILRVNPKCLNFLSFFSLIFCHVLSFSVIFFHFLSFFFLFFFSCSFMFFLFLSFSFSFFSHFLTFSFSFSNIFFHFLFMFFSISFQFTFMFFHVLSCSFKFFHFLSFIFVGCSKSDFFWASISLRFLLTVLI